MIGAPQYIDIIRDNLGCLSIIEAVNSGGCYVGTARNALLRPILLHFQTSKPFVNG